jgi:hypothetical protein
MRSRRRIPELPEWLEPEFIAEALADGHAAALKHRGRKATDAAAALRAIADYLKSKAAELDR